MTDLASLDATAQAALVRGGEASASELVEAAIARIEALDGDLNAVIHPLFDKAAATAARGVPDGPFAGVPLLVKDLSCYTEGDPVHEGMAFLRDAGWTADHDMELARRFRRAGFVICGRTNTPELGVVPTTEPAVYGATRNPWDLTRSPGGSSGGSAAAVAAGMVPVAHGNDGGGSIRIPAAQCGLVGLKPTRARVPLGPDFGDLLGGLVAEFVLTRSVRDAGAVLDAVAGAAAGDPYAVAPPQRPFAAEVGAAPGRLRIGLTTSPPGGRLTAHADCVAAARSAAVTLAGLGHDVGESYPAALDDEGYLPKFMVRWTAGVEWNLRHWSARVGRTVGPGDVEPATWALAEMGRRQTAADYLEAIEYAQVLSRRVASWWHEDGFDLLLTPTTAEPATALGEFDAPAGDPLAPIRRSVPLATFTAPFNSTGQPAISLPLHQTADGLPVGVQLVAAFGREDMLLQVAAQLEQACPWADRTPPL